MEKMLNKYFKKTSKFTPKDWIYTVK